MVLKARWSSEGQTLMVKSQSQREWLIFHLVFIIRSNIKASFPYGVEFGHFKFIWLDDSFAHQCGLYVSRDKLSISRVWLPWAGLNCRIPIEWQIKSTFS
jgi:hypothetical protein